jgi:hypothetical protein
MAKKAKKQTARGRKQDRARVAGRQKYEVDYEAKKARKSAGAVKKAVDSRKKVESVLTARVLANRKRRAKVASKR